MIATMFVFHKIRIPVFFLLPLLLLTLPPALFSQQSAPSPSVPDPSPPHGLEPLLEKCDHLWQADLAIMLEKFDHHGFKWMSSNHTALRSVSPTLRMFDEKVGETVLRAKDGKVFRVDISIYNRGDHGPINYNDFSNLASRWEKQITQTTRTKPEPETKAKDSAVDLDRVLWYTDSSTILLETSKTRGEAQFMRLRMAPKPKGAFYLGNSTGVMRKTAKLSDLQSHIKRTSTGDVLIQGIPMVDQGPKGYCAVASAERVFRYYGLETDQHEMAELARTSTSRGTSPSLMYDALKQASLGAQLRVFSIIEWDTKKFFDDIKAYNRLAKKENVQQAPDDWRQISYLDQVYDALDPKVYKKHKMERGNYFDSFNKQIEQNVDEGIPLFWGIHLGMYPEPEIPQARGGHMRLIIGYNQMEKTILYTDSWGPGHELKRMPADQAFAITNGLFIIKPAR